MYLHESLKNRKASHSKLTVFPIVFHKCWRTDGNRIWTDWRTSAYGRMDRSKKTFIYRVFKNVTQYTWLPLRLNQGSLIPHIVHSVVLTCTEDLNRNMEPWIFSFSIDAAREDRLSHWVCFHFNRPISSLAWKPFTTTNTIYDFCSPSKMKEILKKIKAN